MFDFFWALVKGFNWQTCWISLYIGSMLLECRSKFSSCHPSSSSAWGRGVTSAFVDEGWVNELAIFRLGGMTRVDTPAHTNNQKAKTAKVTKVVCEKALGHARRNTFQRINQEQPNRDHKNTNTHLRSSQKHLFAHITPQWTKKNQNNILRKQTLFFAVGLFRESFVRGPSSADHALYLRLRAAPAQAAEEPKGWTVAEGYRVVVCLWVVFTMFNHSEEL